MQVHIVAVVISFTFETCSWHQNGRPVFSVTAASTLFLWPSPLPQERHLPGKDASVKCFDAVLGKVHLPCWRFIAVEMLYFGIHSPFLCLWHVY